jgi:hypothetical protein
VTQDCALPFWRLRFALSPSAQGPVCASAAQPAAQHDRQQHLRVLATFAGPAAWFAPLAAQAATWALAGKANPRLGHIRPETASFDPGRRDDRTARHHSRLDKTPGRRSFTPNPRSHFISSLRLVTSLPWRPEKGRWRRRRRPPHRCARPPKSGRAAVERASRGAL